MKSANHLRVVRTDFVIDRTPRKHHNPMAQLWIGVGLLVVSLAGIAVFVGVCL